MEEAIRQGDLPTVAALAYLGDAVHSLDIRRRAVAAGLCKSGALHNFSTGIVNAAAQAAMLEAITPVLTEDEQSICRRAANSKHLQAPKHASDSDYRKATAFEALLGALSYLGREERLATLLELAYTSAKGEKNDTED